MKNLSSDMGILGVLIYLRLQANHNIIINCSKQKDHNNLLKAEEQVAFNNQNSKGGIPTNSSNFLVFCAERMMNIAAFEQAKESMCNVT